MNNPDKVGRLKELTLADIAHTKPNCAIKSPQKNMLLENTISIILGLPATSVAVAPVSNKAVHIQIYTLRISVLVATAVVSYCFVEIFVS